MLATNNESQSFINFLCLLEPLDASFIKTTETHTINITIKKNALLPIEVNGENEYIFFIIKGLVRAYIFDEGKDITAWLAAENNLVGNFRNPTASKPTYIEHFQALEDSELLVIPYSFIDKLYLDFPETNILARKLMAIHYHIAQERAILSRIPSAEVRYKKFNEGHPTLRFRVPIKYLATYLGMRIETLSRIRKKAKQE